MPDEATRQLLQEYFRRPDGDFFTEDAQLHDTSQPHALRGRDSIAAFLRLFLDAFPDGAYELHNLLTEGRLAVAEWTFRGTNSGPAMGVPATGRRVEFSGVTVYEVEDGRFARARIYYDTGNLADQLGFQGGRIPSTERGQWAEWWERREE